MSNDLLTTKMILACDGPLNGGYLPIEDFVTDLDGSRRFEVGDSFYELEKWPNGETVAFWEGVDHLPESVS